MLKFIRTFEILRHNTNRSKFCIFFALWRYEVFVSPWERLPGEPLIQREMKPFEDGYTLEMWMPRFHVVIDKLPPGKPAVQADPIDDDDISYA